MFGFDFYLRFYRDFGNFLFTLMLSLSLSMVLYLIMYNEKNTMEFKRSDGEFEQERVYRENDTAAYALPPILRTYRLALLLEVPFVTRDVFCSWMDSFMNGFFREWIRWWREALVIRGSTVFRFGTIHWIIDDCKRRKYESVPAKT